MRLRGAAGGGGADASCAPQDRTVLHFAAAGGHLDCVSAALAPLSDAEKKELLFMKDNDVSAVRMVGGAGVRAWAGRGGRCGMRVGSIWS